MCVCVCVCACLLHETRHHSGFKCYLQWCTVSQTQNINAPPSHIILTSGKPVLGLSSWCWSFSEETTSTNCNACCLKMKWPGVPNLCLVARPAFRSFSVTSINSIVCSFRIALPWIWTRNLPCARWTRWLLGHCSDHDNLKSIIRIRIVWYVYI